MSRTFFESYAGDQWNQDLIYQGVELWTSSWHLLILIFRICSLGISGMGLRCCKWSFALHNVILIFLMHMVTFYLALASLLLFDDSSKLNKSTSKEKLTHDWNPWNIPQLTQKWPSYIHMEANYRKCDPHFSSMCIDSIVIFVIHTFSPYSFNI